MSEITATNAGAVSAAASARYYVREHHPENGTLLGFWLYLMSDCLIFACLFATYAVLGRNYAGGPSGAELFDLPLVAHQHGASCCCRRSPTASPCWNRSASASAPPCCGWASPACSALAFLGLELYEFAHLIHEGAGPQRSAFLSAFFALVGTHGLHVIFGIDLAGDADVPAQEARPDPGKPPPPGCACPCSGTSWT